MGRIWMLGGGGSGGDLDVVTAGAEDILSGKVIVDKNGNPLTGSMPDNSTLTSNGTVPGMSSRYPNVASRVSDNMQINTNTDNVSRLSIRVPKGFYPGGNYVSVPSSYLGNASASDIRSGKTATSSNGVKLSGSLAAMNGGTYTPSTSQQTVNCSGKIMNSNVIIKPIPGNYINTGSWTVFNNGTFSGGFGWVPNYVANRDPLKGVMGGSLQYVNKNPKIITTEVVMFNRAIDTSLYKKITVVFDVRISVITGNSYIYFRCGSWDLAKGDRKFAADSQVIRSSGIYTVDFDIRDLTGQRFIGFNRNVPSNDINKNNYGLITKVILSP